MTVSGLEQDLSSEKPLYVRFSDEQKKTLLDDIGKIPPFRLNGLLMMVACALGLALLGFLTIELTDPYKAAVLDQEESMFYGFQIPFSAFMGAFLGPVAGTVAVFLYLLTGLLFFPVFAGGGGLDYVAQPGFAYLVGMAVGCFYTGKLMTRALGRKSRSGRSLLILLAGFAGVLVTHLVGSVGLGILWMFGLVTFPEVQHLWIQLTAAPVAYDISAAILLLCLVRVVRLVFWLVLY